jgi:hypothetical protein
MGLLHLPQLAQFLHKLGLELRPLVSMYLLWEPKVAEDPLI